MLRTLRRADQGFTLIELLVVILIIGVLAAIAIPSFLNQRRAAHDAGAKVVARTAQTAEEVAFTDAQAYVSQAAGAGPAGALNAVEGTLTAASAPCVGTPPYAVAPCGLTVVAAGGGYAISVTSQTGVVFSLTRSSAGTVSRTCDVTGAVGGGGCGHVVSGSGTW